MPDTYSYCCRLPLQLLLLPLQLLQYSSDDHDHHHHPKRNPSAVYIYMGVPKNWGTLFWDPYSKDPTTYLG